MPKKKSIPQSVAPVAEAAPVTPAPPPPITLAPIQPSVPSGIDRPEIQHNPFLVLTPMERAKCRAILTDETFLKLLGAARKFKPSSAICAGSAANLRRAKLRSTIRLSELRGWELYEIAMYAVLTEKLPQKPIEEPNYPDTGRLDAHWGDVPSTPKK